ncbi:unnamed protein product [Arabidopsis halleri]
MFVHPFVHYSIGVMFVHSYVMYTNVCTPVCTLFN